MRTFIAILALVSLTLAQQQPDSDPAPKPAAPGRSTVKKHKVDGNAQTTTAAPQKGFAPLPSSTLRPKGASNATGGQPFECPEQSGIYPDHEQCDLYYICHKGVADEYLCDDGLMYDHAVANRERCSLPFNVNCGDRIYLQDPTPGIDPHCERANGFFENEDPKVCDKYYNCDRGTAHAVPCAAPLHFDIKLGTCTRPEQLSEEARRCATANAIAAKEVDGFTCPGKESVGPQGQLEQHPLYAHPTDCRAFFTCTNGKDPNKIGCEEGQVFDGTKKQCKKPEEVPECACWYGCDEKSKCPETCQVDCSCPSS